MRFCDLSLLTRLRSVVIIIEYYYFSSHLCHTQLLCFVIHNFLHLFSFYYSTICLQLTCSTTLIVYVNIVTNCLMIFQVYFAEHLFLHFAFFGMLEFQVYLLFTYFLQIFCYASLLVDFI